MGARKPLCRRYSGGDSFFGNDLGRYLAAPEVAELPRDWSGHAGSVTRGWAVGCGRWFWFPAREPAEAFGRAVRMSEECSGYGLYQASRAAEWCPIHEEEEQVLLILAGSHDRKPGEVEVLKRFVQGVKEHPWSSGWREPTGYITDYNQGRPRRTARRSLPL